MLDQLVDTGVVEPEHRDEIVDRVDGKRVRNFEEINNVVSEAEKHLRKADYPNQYRKIDFIMLTVVP